MTKTEFISLKNGTQICAPASLGLMTNFVLKEQGDWFENEIDFVREYIQPDMQALDIGANYGLYTTAIAENLGESGHLCCFEPTPATATALRKTIDKNAMTDRVTVIEAGLSDHEGQATFYTFDNAELNSLTNVNQGGGTEQTIELLTLDQCKNKFEWSELDFIKLDAEGEELKILAAGKDTLEQFSPLVMMELKHGDKINRPLIDAFQALGYDTYCLIPGINVLAPFNTESNMDGFLLNLFCCKPDRAKALEERDLLVSHPEMPRFPEEINVAELWPLSKLLGSLKFEPSDSRNYQEAFVCALYANHQSLSRKERYQFLGRAIAIVQQSLNQGESKVERLSTFARIAFDFGQQSIGLKILGHIIEQIKQNTRLQIAEPFMPPGPEFDHMEIKDGNLGRWFCAAMIDQNIRKHAHSCYFSGEAFLPYFTQLEKLGYLEEDMQRRRDLIHARQAGA